MDRASIVQMLLIEEHSRRRKTVKWIVLKSDINLFLLLLKIMADIIKFVYSPIINESMAEYEYHEYELITDSRLNDGGDIRISIESQDAFTHPSESLLIIEGRLTEADGTLCANTDEVDLTNNAIMHLFSRIEYHLSNQLIE